MDFYWIAFIMIFSTLFFLRLFFKLRAGLIKSLLTFTAEGIPTAFLRLTLELFHFPAVFLHIFFPRLLPWMYLGLPPALKITGLALAGLSLLLLFVSHLHLGGWFTTAVTVKADHRLIRSGPYRFIRHPMYVAYFGLFAGTLFFSENWVIGVSGILIMLSVMILRLPREEKALADRFGREYEEYARTTPRFCPVPRARPVH